MYTPANFEAQYLDDQTVRRNEENAIQLEETRARIYGSTNFSYVRKTNIKKTQAAAASHGLLVVDANARKEDKNEWLKRKVDAVVGKVTGDIDKLRQKWVKK